MIISSRTTAKSDDNSFYFIFQLKLADIFHFTTEQFEFNLAEVPNYSQVNMALLTVLKQFNNCFHKA